MEMDGTFNLKIETLLTSLMILSQKTQPTIASIMVVGCQLKNSALNTFISLLEAFEMAGGIHRELISHKLICTCKS